MPQNSLSKKFYPRLITDWKTLISIILFSGFIFAGLLIFYFRLQIKTIQIESSASKHDVSGLESLKGKNLFFISTATINNTLSEHNPSLVVEEIRKEYPDLINIKIRKLTPLVQLQLSQGYAQLSENAKVFRKIKDLDRSLPQMEFYQKFDYFQISVGDSLDYREIATALLLLKRCQDLELEVESIDISGLSMIVFNLKGSEKGKNGRKFFFTAEKDPVRQANEMESLVSQFKIKAQDFQTMDLRFDKPVVRF